MSADWIAFILFVILSIAAVIAETMWLTRRQWTTPGKTIAYVLITDILSVGIGMFTFFVTVGVLMMMAFGASGQGGASPDAVFWAVSIFGLVFPLLFLLSLKRLFLLIFRMRTGGPAWAYSIVITALISMSVFVLPVLAFWAFAYYL